MIYVGTSGWQYEAWKRRFYPATLPKSKWLEFFSRRFATVEVNNSFYRLPSKDAFRWWRAESAPGFVVCVKASRFITHVKRLRDPKQPLALFWERAAGLGDKLGPVLFQLPPRFRADPARLRTFVRALPKGIVAAFEFRDPSWDSPGIRDILHDAGAAMVIADAPGNRGTEVVTGGWAYVRFHKGGPVRPAYGRRKMQDWAARIADLPARHVYVYFNNDTGAAAVRDAPLLIEALERRGARVAHPRGHGAVA